MVRRGLLVEDVRGFSLRAGTDSVAMDDVADAIDRDPTLAEDQVNDRADDRVNDRARESP
jgi:hypothetical protein